MDIYKLKFTRLQQEILRFLFLYAGKSFNKRALSKKLDVSPTAISNALENLEKENLIISKMDKESQTTEIKLNLENPRIFGLKRAENLRFLYEVGLVEFLSDKFPGSTIILFGSYAMGEDTFISDIDIAIIGKEKQIDLKEFEKIFERKIILQFYPNLRDIHKHLKENILNGIVLKGGIEL
jgi:predicted nucleotidyltransferase